MFETAFFAVFIILVVAALGLVAVRSIRQESENRRLVSKSPLVIVTRKKVTLTYDWETIGLFNTSLTNAEDKFTYLFEVEAIIDGVSRQTIVEVTELEWNRVDEYDTIVNPLFHGPLVESVSMA